MKKRSVMTVRFALAGLVIAFVATRVPWVDRVEATGQSGEVEGVITGAWRDDQVTFTAADLVTIPQEWQGNWADELRVGGPCDLKRGGPLTWEPGLWTVLRDLRAMSILGVLLAVLGGLFFGVTRWWRLLCACGVPTSYLVTMRLTLLGMFFNLIIPGLTGGDLVKAGLAAKEHPDGRAAAVMAVGLDRLIGLWTLLWIAAICAISLGDQLSVLVGPLLGISVLGTAALLLFAVPALRNAFGAKRVLARLPRKLTGAVEALRGLSDKPRELIVGVLLSAGNHLCIGAAVFSVARGIGDETSFIGCLSATVVASAVSAVPLAPGGWGVGEAAYAAMFALLGSGETVGFAVSVSYRLCQTGISLLCGAALWRGNKREWREEAGLGAGPD